MNVIKKKLKNCWIISGLIFLLACHESTQSNENSELQSKDLYHLTTTHAKRFDIDYSNNGYVLITVNSPWSGAEVKFEYALVPKEFPVPDLPDHVKMVRTPMKSIVVTSTSHLPHLEYLESLDKLIGFPNGALVYSKMIKDRMKDGRIRDLGGENGINLEILLASKPDLVMDYSTGSEYDHWEKIENLKIPVVINADYMEETPLGRAEWIKFTGLLVGKEKEADSVFAEIVKRYDELKMKVVESSVQPSVMSGIVYGDIWYMPGGKNFGARFLKDANASYLWESADTKGSLKLSFEHVFEKAKDADLWIGLGGVNSLTELEALDSPAIQRF